jgi:uncharacterized membrane protein YecN with MAPEG domain
MNIAYIVHTYGIIKIKGSLHHAIAKLEHYFTIAFSGAFLTFFSAISDSMLSLANSTKRLCVTWLSANSSLQALVC